MEKYISLQETTEKWDISERCVQFLCDTNRIEGIIQFGRSWAIPRDAIKPNDARKCAKSAIHN